MRKVKVLDSVALMMEKLSEKGTEYDIIGGAPFPLDGISDCFSDEMNIFLGKEIILDDEHKNDQGFVFEDYMLDETFVSKENNAWFTNKDDAKLIAINTDIDYSGDGGLVLIQDDSIIPPEGVSGYNGILLTGIKYLAKDINGIAKEKGWWDTDRNNGELIALMHSELSEALEGLRHGNPPSDHIPEFSSAEEEMADVIIRVLDVCHQRNWRIGEAILAKMEFNKTRPVKHGGKKF